jgi:hypothetical protein
MDHLFTVFMHSVVWHAGTEFAHMAGIPLIGVFVAYGLYRLLKYIR